MDPLALELHFFASKGNIRSVETLLKLPDIKINGAAKHGDTPLL